jgi:myo-inositol-1(or 4)-monophosphatase
MKGEKLQELLHDTISLTKQVAAFIKHEQEYFKASAIEYKGLNDLVSFVDKEAERKLVTGLAALLPEAGFIAEEGTSSKKGEKYNWVIDPLDGTTNFIHGLPVFAISVALMDDDTVILGVVLEINRDECFYAIKGGKAFCNGQQIKVSDAPALQDSLLATGFPYYNFNKMENYLAILKDYMQKTHGLRRMGSAAVDLVYVACGRFEAFFEYNLKPWDVAAGTLIVQEAGGRVTDFKDGEDFIFGGELLAANRIHAEALDVIKQHWD